MTKSLFNRTPSQGRACCQKDWHSYFNRGPDSHILRPAVDVCITVVVHADVSVPNKVDNIVDPTLPESLLASLGQL